MNMYYSRELKKQLCENICIHGASTLKTTNEYNVPIKTLEKWVTAFYKDSHYFDPIIEVENEFKPLDKPTIIDYNDLSNDELIKELMKKDIEIARLKKGYMMKGDGSYVMYKK